MKDSDNNQSMGLEPSQSAAGQTAPQGSQIRNDLFPEICVTWLAISLPTCQVINSAKIRPEIAFRLYFGSNAGGEVCSSKQYKED